MEGLKKSAPMNDIILHVIMDGECTIHRFLPDALLPPELYQSGFYSISKTDDELSVVCLSDIQLDSNKSEPGWVVIQVQGPLDFGQTGILSGISSVLAAAKISLFAISTYDTDYIMVKKEAIMNAITSLTESGYRFI